MTPTPPVDPRRFHVPAPELGGTFEPVADPIGPYEKQWQEPGSDPDRGPKPAPRPRKRRRSRRGIPGMRLVRWLALLGLLATLAFGLIAFVMWRGVSRVDTRGALSPSGAGTNVLLVGTDSREGLDENVANAGAIFGEGAEGLRTDTIAVLHLDGDGSKLLAIPRDLWVNEASGGQRINSTLTEGGAEELLRTIEDELGISIDRYMEVNFAGFRGLVDALGSVSVTIENPAFDNNSGLNLPVAGTVELDPDQALAFVRSRHYVEIIDGQERVDPRSDLGRVVRQQAFLASVFDELGSTRNPITLLRVMSGVKSSIRVDESMSFIDALRLAWKLRGLDPEGVTVPVTDMVVGTAQVLDLNEAEAVEVLAPFR